MRLHKNSASKMPRKPCVRRCIYCHHPVDWYERHDTKTWLPLLLQEFPSPLLPRRYHWSVFNGLAYLGDGGTSYCRIAHPAVCSALEHDDERVLRGLRRRYAVETRSWIEKGEFVPAPREVLEHDVVEQHVPRDVAIRHVITYTCWTWLAPAAVDQVQCVALAASTGERCKNTVLDDDLYQGHWAQVDIPMPPGRAGQETLWAGQQMWVYDLNALFPNEYSRWRHQRCSLHESGGAPDATMPQWVTFDTFRHQDFVTYERPKMSHERRREDHPLLSLLRPVKDASQCNADNCTNRSYQKENEKWLCWECNPIAIRRAKTHAKWQREPQEDPPF
ncbi:DUF6083 domain-containing protein [Streptomyces sp. NPDC017979]|uniref:DUF6083 domain-containing protein n=1 Tax=Streptomyces sp. NPDC017979 TaxID=3365024 RepID=UPI0037BD2144